MSSFNNLKFGLHIKLSLIETLISNATKLSDKSIFFLFNSNNIIIKSSNSQISISKEYVELYEIYKEDQEEYEIMFNACHFIIMLKDIFLPEINIIIKLIGEYILILSSLSLSISIF